MNFTLTTLSPRTRGILGGVVSFVVLLALGIGAFGIDTFNTAALKSDIAAAASQPTAIKAFTPKTAAIGEVIDITLNVAIDTIDEFTFSFAAPNAARVTATAAELVTLANGSKVVRVTVPTGATTGRVGFSYAGELTLSTMDFTLKTTNTTTTYAADASSSTGDDSTAMTSTTGTNSSVPTITGLTPSSGPVGTAVYIALDKIPTNQNAYKLYFSGVNGARVEAPDREVVYVKGVQAVRTRVPVGATTGRIAVSVGGVTSESEWDFTVADDANSANTPNVTISELSPASTDIGKTIYLAGSGFAERADDNIVEFAAPNATTVRSRNVKVTSLSGTPVLQVIVPEGAITGRVSVTVAGSAALSPTELTIGATTGTSTSKADVTPTIAELSATDLQPGDQLLVAGQNLNQPNAILKIGGVESPIENRSKSNGKDVLLTTVPQTARSGFVTLAVGEQLAIYPTKVVVVGSTGGAPIIDVSRMRTLPAHLDVTTSQLSLYTFISDPDGVTDIDNVTLDLSALGGSPAATMQPGTAAGTGRTYTLEGVMLTQILTADTEYRVPVTATDKSGLVTTNEFTLCTGTCLTPDQQAMTTSDVTVDPAMQTATIDAHAAAPAIIRPTTPTEVSVAADRGFLRFSWSANDTSIVGYHVYYATTSGAYLHRRTTGLVVPYFLSDLDRGVMYDFVITSVNADGIESLPSEEVSATMPLTADETASTGGQTLTYLSADGAVVTDPAKIAASLSFVAPSTSLTQAAADLHGSAPHVDTLPVVPLSTTKKHSRLTDVGPAENLVLAVGLAFLVAAFIAARRVTRRV